MYVNSFSVELGLGEDYENVKVSSKTDQIELREDINYS